jgi:ankyrin repeat protein
MKSSRRTFVAASAAALAANLPVKGEQMDIFEAAAAGNSDRVKELCKDAPDVVNAKHKNGRTPLYFAAEAGQVDMISLLMMHGVDLSAGSQSPMIAVADYHDPAVAADMAQPLLANGSRPNVSRTDGVTALHLAAIRGNMDVARMLIHRGAVVDPADAIVAKTVPDAAKIERVYFGARYRQDLRGNTLDRGRVDADKSRAEHDTEDTQGLPQEVINQFVTFSHFDGDRVKQMHKDSAALLSTRATWDELAIEAAAHMGLGPLTEYLADAGSPISTCTAVVLGLTETVRVMIREDRDRTRERGAHDFPLLAYTVFGAERPEIAELLLKAGADPNAMGFGQTPLHIAAAKGYLEVAGLLLDRGAAVNAAPRSRKGPGPTPLAVAITQNQVKMAELLKSRGGQV